MDAHAEDGSNTEQRDLHTAVAPTTPRDDAPGDPVKRQDSRPRGSRDQPARTTDRRRLRTSSISSRVCDRPGNRDDVAATAAGLGHHTGSALPRALTMRSSSSEGLPVFIAVFDRVDCAAFEPKGAVVGDFLRTACACTSAHRSRLDRRGGCELARDRDRVLPRPPRPAPGSGLRVRESGLHS